MADNYLRISFFGLQILEVCDRTVSKDQTLHPDNILQALSGLMPHLTLIANVEDFSESVMF